MKYRTLTPSELYPCDIDFLKSQLRITHTAHDLYLQSLIIAATDWACGFTGRQINYAILQAYCGYYVNRSFSDLMVIQDAYVFTPGSSFHHRYFSIDKGPVISIIKVEYYNTSGVLIEITLSDYFILKEEYSTIVYLNDAFTFVDIDTRRKDCIVITYAAGWGGTATGHVDFPEVIKNAVALRAAQLYTNPADGVDEKTSVSENLLKSFRCPIV